MNWDSYFHGICKSVASKSPCLSRQIGAILVRDKSIVSTGYNGPPRGVPHCGTESIAFLGKSPEYSGIIKNISVSKTCPRKAKGYASGTHLDECPAQHAEENAVSNAARNGTSTIGCTLYLNTVIPCQKCFGTLINAGIIEIVCDDAVCYDEHTQFLINNSNINIRTFNHG